MDMTIFIKTLRGSNYAFKCNYFETIKSIKEKYIEKCFGSQVEYTYKRKYQAQTPKDIIENPLKINVDPVSYFDYRYRLIYKGRCLNDDVNNKTLADYGVAPESTFHLLERLRGGGMPLHFVDVEKGQIQNLEFSNQAPEWRIVIEGLNLFGKCKNVKCKAYNKEVVYKVGITNKKFNLQENIVEIKCPICNSIVVPNTCGFWKCEYQFEGDKIEGGILKHIDTKSKETIGNNFEYYNPFENPSALWTNLNIYVVEKQDIKYNNYSFHGCGCCWII